MLACIALIPVCQTVLSDATLEALKPVFWLESFALWGFGASWMTKGEVVLKDD